jgi:hypothetical protein
MRALATRTRLAEPVSKEIRIRGKADVANAIRKELEKIVATLRDRVVLYVEVPNVQHKALIGRNG